LINDTTQLYNAICSSAQSTITWLTVHYNVGEYMG